MRQRDMCFFRRCVFFRRLQCHNTTTSFFNTLTFTHTHTHTLTHMTGQQWLIGQVVPDIFRVLQIFLTKKGSASFLTARGSRISKKDFQTCKCFQLFMYVFFFDAGIMPHRFSMIRIFTCHVRSHCWK